MDGANSAENSAEGRTNTPKTAQKTGEIS